MNKLKNTKKSITLDSLAIMVARGFESVQKQLEPISRDVNELKRNVVDLKEGQEEIKLKLDSVAYRFELIELQRRVEILEKKLNARP